MKHASEIPVEIKEATVNTLKQWLHAKESRGGRKTGECERNDWKSIDKADLVKRLNEFDKFTWFPVNVKKSGSKWVVVVDFGDKA